MGKGNSEWYSRGEASRRLAVGHNTFDRIVASGRIGTLQVPGLKQKKYSRADVEALVAAGTRPARVSPAAAGA